MTDVRFDGSAAGDLVATTPLHETGDLDMAGGRLVLQPGCPLTQTDGRFSGGTSGLSIGHVSPEAAAGGAIGLVEQGDIIEIDIPGRSINLAVDAAELERRRQHWQPLEKDVPDGYMRRYRKHVRPACEGAILD
mgnify:CR=1 FL=1